MKGKRIFVVLMIMTVFVGMSFATDLDECRNLNSYFDDSKAVVETKISEYEQKLIATPADNHAYLAMGILYATLAERKDHKRGVAKKSIDNINKFIKKEAHGDKVVLAHVYLGMSTGLMADEGINPIKKTRLANSSFRILDKAVEIAEKNESQDLWYARFMRANVFVAVPSFFGKFEDGAKDFRYVEKVYDDKTYPVQKGTMVVVYFNLGEVEKSEGNINNAIKYWQKTVDLGKELNVNSKEVKSAKKRIKIFVD